MKCSKIISIIFVISMLLTACSSQEVSRAYHESSYTIEKTAELEQMQDLENKCLDHVLKKVKVTAPTCENSENETVTDMIEEKPSDIESKVDNADEKKATRLLSLRDNSNTGHKEESIVPESHTGENYGSESLSNETNTSVVIVFDSSDIDEEESYIYLEGVKEDNNPTLNNDDLRIDNSAVSEGTNAGTSMVPMSEMICQHEWGEEIREEVCEEREVTTVIHYDPYWIGLHFVDAEGNRYDIEENGGFGYYVGGSHIDSPMTPGCWWNGVDYTQVPGTPDQKLLPTGWKGFYVCIRCGAAFETGGEIAHHVTGNPCNTSYTSYVLPTGYKEIWEVQDYLPAYDEELNYTAYLLVGYNVYRYCNKCGFLDYRYLPYEGEEIWYGLLDE